MKQKMDADVAFFDSLQADCDARSTFYGKQVSDAEAEMTAIDATMRESVSGGKEQCRGESASIDGHKNRGPLPPLCC